MKKFFILIIKVLLIGQGALICSSCGFIPNYSSPRALEDDLSKSYDYSIIAQAPDEGAASQEILEGFLNALSDTRNLYETARQYLSSDFAQIWNPLENIYIMLNYEIDNMHFSADIIATVDKYGVYVKTQETLIVDYELTQEDGEIRISSISNGIFITQNNFSIVYNEYLLYFWSLENYNFIQEKRYFASSTIQNTQIINAILAYNNTKSPPEAEIVLQSENSYKIYISKEFLEYSIYQQKIIYLEIKKTLNLGDFELYIDGSILELDF